MSARINTLVIALVAVAVLCGLAVAAQANNITSTSGKYPLRITGIDLGSGHGKLARLTVGSGARFVECGKVTSEAFLPKEQTVGTLQTTYAECFSNNLTSVPATIKMNGCDYVLEATSKTAGRISINCEAGKFIEVNIYENATKHSENKPLCAYRIAAQGPLPGVTLKQSNAGTTTEAVTIELNVKEIKVENTVGSLALCGIAAGKTGTGALTGSKETTGETEAKEHAAYMVA